MAQAKREDRRRKEARELRIARWIVGVLCGLMLVGVIVELRDGAVDFHGTYHSAPDCVLRPRGPSPSGPPIWIGAMGERMLRSVARHADGYISIWHTDAAQAAAERERLETACAEVGRDPAAIELVVGAHVLLPGHGPRESGDSVITGTHEEIAALYGKSESFSKSQLMRAHLRLRELLDQTGEGASCTPLSMTF